jgi:hypothetical protein
MTTVKRGWNAVFFATTGQKTPDGGMCGLLRQKRSPRQCKKKAQSMLIAPSST